MRVETWVAIAACLIGAAAPLVWVSPHLPRKLALLLPAGVAVLPFAAVAGTAWAARADSRSARVAAVVAILVLAIGVGGWWWAAQDPEGFAMMLAALLFVSAAQLLVWLGGAFVSGHMGARTNVRRGRPTMTPRP